MPRVDRRLLTVGLGGLIMVLALVLDMDNYSGFLTLIGSVFVPMLGVLAVDFFCFGGRRGWDVSERAPARWSMIVAWAAGFVAYQLINPGNVGWWSRLWIGRAGRPGVHAVELDERVAAVLRRRGAGDRGDRRPVPLRAW